MINKNGATIKSHSAASMRSVSQSNISSHRKLNPSESQFTFVPEGDDD